MTATYDGSIAAAIDVASEHGVSADDLTAQLEGIVDARSKLRAASGVAVDAVLLAHAGRDVTYLPSTRVPVWAGTHSPASPLVLWTADGAWTLVDGLVHTVEALTIAPELTIVPTTNRWAAQKFYSYAPVELRHRAGFSTAVWRLGLTAHADTFDPTAA